MTAFRSRRNIVARLRLPTTIISILAVIGCAEQGGEGNAAGLAQHSISQAIDARFTEGQLSVSLPYASCSERNDNLMLLSQVDCGSGGIDIEGATKAVEKIRAFVAEGTNGEAASILHTRGLWHLLYFGQPQELEQSVDYLMQSRVLDPGNSSFHSDLAVAFFERARGSDRVFDLVRALDNVERAVILDPKSPHAAFNRAVALERLHLYDLARQAWRNFLNLDADSPWAREAAHRLAALPMTQPRPRSLLEVKALVEQGHQVAREAAMSVLRTRWSPDLAAYNPRFVNVNLTLDWVEAVGELLAVRGGDRTLLEAATLTRLVEQNEGGLDHYRLRIGLRAYSQGYAAYHLPPRDFTQARPFFETAIAHLDGTVLALWARAWLAFIDISDARYDEANINLAFILGRNDLDHYATLQGIARWSASLCAGRQDRRAESLTHALAAAVAFDRADEDLYGGLIDVLIGNNLGLLGDRGSAWRYRYRALKRLGRYPYDRYRHNLLWDAGKAALERGAPYAALAFQTEGITVARATGEPLLLAEALLRNSRIRSMVNDFEAAARDIETARSLQAKIVNPASRQRSSLSADFAEALILRHHDPKKALAHLDRIIPSYEGYLEVRLLEAYALRAQILLDLDQPSLAATDLSAAITRIENQKARVEAERRRRDWLAAAQALYDKMIRILATSLDQPAEALSYVERARTLRSDRNLEATEFKATLPPGASLAAYTVADGHLFIWWIGTDGVRLVACGNDVVAIRQKVDDLSRAVRQGLPLETFLPIAEQLYDTLIAPIASHLTRDKKLTILPDRFLSHIPFAALRNSKNGRYLVEEYTLSYASSMAAYRSDLASPKAKLSLQRPLLVGNPATDPRHHLTDLPGATAEVVALKALYPDALVLTANEATPNALRIHLKESEIFHFAGHAVFNDLDPKGSFLYLASSEDSDGRLPVSSLTIKDIIGLRLVVLSACRSSKVSGARVETVSGLARVVHEAGVYAVLGMLWEIEDQAGRMLSLGFHQELKKGVDPADALRHIQRLMIKNPDPSKHHPAAWAAAQIFGDFAIHTES